MYFDRQGKKMLDYLSAVFLSVCVSSLPVCLFERVGETTGPILIEFFKINPL